MYLVAIQPHHNAHIRDTIALIKFVSDKVIHSFGDNVILYRFSSSEEAFNFADNAKIMGIYLYLNYVPS